MLQSSIYADLHIQDFGYSYVSRLTALPTKLTAKISFERVFHWFRDAAGHNDLAGLNAHLRRDIGIDG